MKKENKEELFALPNSKVSYNIVIVKCIGLDK